MIESEEKKKELISIISHWAKFTRADRELRDGDIPNLVNQIIQSFYRIRCSCGHYVRAIDEGITYTHKDRDGSEICGFYCKDCYNNKDYYINENVDG